MRPLNPLRKAGFYVEHAIDAYGLNLCSPAVIGFAPLAPGMSISRTKLQAVLDEMKRITLERFAAADEALRDMPELEAIRCGEYKPKGKA